MLDSDKKKILDKNYLLNKKKDAKTKTVFNTLKNRYFLLGVFFGLLILVLAYFISDYSNIYHISVEGNIYLKNEDIIRLSGIEKNDKYLLVFPSIKQKKLLSSPYIEEAKVEMLDDRIIKISVKEVKQVGYIFEDGLSNVLLIDGTRIVLDKSNYYLIEKLPLIEGYKKDQIKEILRGFKLIDYKTIDEISEIHRYPFSYDENMMEVIMRDGNYCFVSWTGLNMLSEYYQIISGIDASLGNVCIYLDELTNSGYTSICPWQEEIKEETDVKNTEKEINPVKEEQTA